ncbi:MAG: hypothetical protein ACHQT7_01320 [Candidatus Levyibacteriota bacterium]
MMSLKWQRIILLIILAYEGIGGLLGGVLLTIAPDGHLMNIPVGVMYGFFPDFLIPGIILTFMGILTSVAFFVVLLKSKYDWVFAGVAMVGFIIWFTVEIAVLRQPHWLHIMWGVPVLIGALIVFPMLPQVLKKKA